MKNVFNNYTLNKSELSFSIITPVFNDKRILTNLNSVFKQTYKNYEHIVIDGGSNFETLEILNNNKKLPNIIISQKDNGIYDALNKGINLSQGDVIGILNADDFYYPNALEIAKKYFEKEEIDFLFGSVMKDRLHHGFHPKKIRWKFNVFPSHSCGFFVKKKIHDQIGLYNLNFKYSSDRDFIFRLIKKGFKGTATKKDEIFGEFYPFGISSKVSYFKNLHEEFSIRLNNKQNKVELFFLLIFTIIYKLYFLTFGKFLRKLISCK